MTDDRAIANKQFEDLIDAAKMQDADALKALFSQNVLNEVENIEESIQKLFDYFEGEMVSYNDWAGPGVTAKNDADGYWKRLTLRMRIMWEYGHCISSVLRMTQTRIVRTEETEHIHPVSILARLNKIAI
ncbi:MAG: DUF5104 domain-containing protein [Firmicutes bacterium]|nr:DUF5104 domain-containing protein [Bacillota bacterium]